MEYRNIVDFLLSCRNFNSIDVIAEALSLLRLRIDPEKVIVVAGTNGKGSTCATLQTLLCAAGKNVGFFSSPHLEKINERINFNGVDISDEDFCSVFHAVHPKIMHFDLSYFEYLTIMAAYYFFETHKSSVDFAIFEVGLGGSLDATNATTHGISVITRLGIDHEKELGHSILQIARNKFGIIGHRNRVFHVDFAKLFAAKTLEDMLNLMGEYRKSKDVTFAKSYDYSTVVHYHDNYPIFFIKTKFGEFQMNLPGERAAENTALAITVFDHLMNYAGTDKYLPAIAKVRWPGRMERRLYRGREIYLSGDHNPQGIRSMLDILSCYRFNDVHFVVGICYDKSFELMLSLLMATPGAKLYLTETTERALLINDYGEDARRSAQMATAHYADALDAAVAQASSDDVIVVTGSLYLVGAVRAISARPYF
jgi:dihydrofolate synthase/folylpolyglutamate synthase